MNIGGGEQSLPRFCVLKIIYPPPPSYIFKYATGHNKIIIYVFMLFMLVQNKIGKYIVTDKLRLIYIIGSSYI